MQAYVFVECDGDPEEAVRDLRKIDGVKRADGLYGALEVVAIIEAPDLVSLDKVIGRIQEVDNVAFTDTRIARDI